MRGQHGEELRFPVSEELRSPSNSHVNLPSLEWILKASEDAVSASILTATPKGLLVRTT